MFKYLRAIGVAVVAAATIAACPAAAAAKPEVEVFDAANKVVSAQVRDASNFIAAVNNLMNVNISPEVLRTISTAAQSGEGVIRITERVCGTTDRWQSIAADNQIKPAAYLVLLGQWVLVNCNSQTPADVLPVPAPAQEVIASSEVAQATIAQATTSGWVNPLPGACIISGFHTAARPSHDGIDLPAGSGTPIYAAASGTVRTAWDGGAGNYTEINHGGGLVTVYMHQSGYAVTSGWVNAGDVIGYVGSTGNSRGPHLHLEVHTAGAWSGKVDPAGFFPSYGISWGWC